MEGHQEVIKELDYPVGQSEEGIDAVTYRKVRIVEYLCCYRGDFDGLSA